MNKKNLTAVEWLIQELGEYFPHEVGGIEMVVNKAKQMEKEQYETFFKQGFKYRSYIHDSIYGGADKWEGVPKNFDDYYNETYGGNNE